MTKPPRIFSTEWKTLHNWDTKTKWQKVSFLIVGENKTVFIMMCVILFLVLNGAYSYKHDMNQAIKLGYFCNDAAAQVGFMPEEYYANVGLDKCNEIIKQYNDLNIQGMNISQLNLSLVP